MMRVKNSAEYTTVQGQLIQNAPKPYDIHLLPNENVWKNQRTRTVNRVHSSQKNPTPHIVTFIF